MKHLPPLFQLLFFYGSRSVSFGLWLFIVATLLLIYRFIDATAWQFITGGCTVLVGGRTVLAEYFGKKGKIDAPPPAQ